jgi:hypothetical protein
MHLTGCGGGEGSSSGSDVVQPAPSPIGTLQPACEGCAAVSSTQYAGIGTGIWSIDNTSTGSQSVPVSISGLSGQDVTLVLINTSSAEVSFPEGAFGGGFQANQSAAQNQVRPPKPDTRSEEIGEFNRVGWYKKALASMQSPRESVMAPPAQVAYAPGDTRIFYNFNEKKADPRNTILARQTTASDGRKVNLWVESTERSSDKVSESILDALFTSLTSSDGVYDGVTQLGGPLWGEHKYDFSDASETASEAILIDGADQPLDVVLLNLVNDKKPLGTLGYFFNGNSLRKAEYSLSNESLSIYLDTETLYLGESHDRQSVASTLAHELMHMSNFYRRSVSMGYQYTFPAWIDEMTAMMAEDVMASRLSDSFNPIRDIRMPNYLGWGLPFSSFNCSIERWTPFSEATGCESYSVSGSFGGFLLRQLGTDFYKDMLRRKQAQPTLLLDQSIKAFDTAGNASLENAFRRFVISAAGAMPSAGAPVGYGFPARRQDGFDIPVINASAYSAARLFPSAAPVSIQSFGAVPVIRRGVSGTFSETVTLPANTSLFIVIH